MASCSSCFRNVLDFLIFELWSKHRVSFVRLLMILPECPLPMGKRERLNFDEVTRSCFDFFGLNVILFVASLWSDS